MLGWHDSGRLKPEEREQLRMLAAQLQQSWGGGQPVVLSELLCAIHQHIRLPFLRELIRLDLELSYRHRAPRRLDHYLAEIPEIGSASALPVELILDEYRLRRVHGEAPTLSGYRERFPAQFPLLEERLGQNEQGTLPGSERPTLTAPPLAPPIPPPLAPAPGTDASALPTHTSPGVPLPPVPLERLAEQARASHDHPGMGYTLLDRLGAGACGEVFRAYAPGGVPVAVKRLFRPVQDVVSQREKQSLELIKALRHPYLLQTQAYWVKDERLHVAMELADGSLHDWFLECRKKEMPGIPFQALLAFFREAAEALDYLHDKGRIHRDIKPANLLRLHGHAKVADFGLARLFEGEEIAATFCGTARYMAPEMWKSHANPRSDQYCLAVAFVEMYIGRPPYSGNDLFTLESQHRTGKPDLEGFTRAEQFVLRKALAKNPEDRYPNCTHFINALAEAHALAHAPKKPRPRRLPRLLLLALQTATVLIAGLVLVALGAVIAGRFTGPDSSPPPPPQLPEGFQAVESSEVVNSRPRRIAYTALKGVEPIEFLLIPKEGPRDPPTFYIMRDKVTCRQFRAALDEPAMQKLLEDWGKRFPWAIQRAWQKALLDPGNANRPVMDVTVLEAHCFAELLGGKLGGKLPSEKQWDKAGGRFDRRTGPFQDGWKRLLRLTAPALIGTDRLDESIHGCRGMAANGREWTRNLERRGDVEVPLDRPDPRDEVNLRGKSFASDEPFRFALLDDELSGYPEARGYGSPAYDIGFRAVLEPRD